jgi:hypothetical protein
MLIEDIETRATTRDYFSLFSSGQVKICKNLGGGGFNHPVSQTRLKQNPPF